MECEDITLSEGENTIDVWQKYIRYIYKDFTDLMDTAKVTYKLFEEVNEITLPYSTFLAEQKKLLELPDLFTWLCSLVNLKGYSIQLLTEEYYKNGCPGCGGHNFCRCETEYPDDTWKEEDDGAKYMENMLVSDITSDILKQKIIEKMKKEKMVDDETQIPKPRTWSEWGRKFGYMYLNRAGSFSNNCKILLLIINKILSYCRKEKVLRYNLNTSEVYTDMIPTLFAWMNIIYHQQKVFQIVNENDPFMGNSILHVRPLSSPSLDSFAQRKIIPITVIEHLLKRKYGQGCPHCIEDREPDQSCQCEPVSVIELSENQRSKLVKFLL